MTIDVLAPEGLGERTDLTTTPPGRTLQVPGGTQALDRTELVPVASVTRSGHVPRPSLLGAVVAKALAVAVDGAPAAQRLDFVFLFSLTGDPLALAAELTPEDRRRIRARTGCSPGDRADLPAVVTRVFACFHGSEPGHLHGAVLHDRNGGPRYLGDHRSEVSFHKRID